jgi:hypothetical protein
VGLAACTTEVEEVIDGGPPRGVVDGSGSVPHRVLKTTSMVGPWGALPVGLAASTTEVEDDVDGRPPRGRC